MAFFVITTLSAAVWAFVFFRTQAVWRLMEYMALLYDVDIQRHRAELVSGLRLFGAIGLALSASLAILSGLALTG